MDGIGKNIYDWGNSLVVALGLPPLCTVEKPTATQVARYILAHNDRLQLLPYRRNSTGPALLAVLREMGVRIPQLYKIDGNYVASGSWTHAGQKTARLYSALGQSNTEAAARLLAAIFGYIANHEVSALEPTSWDKIEKL